MLVGIHVKERSGRRQAAQRSVSWHFTWGAGRPLSTWVRMSPADVTLQGAAGKVPSKLARSTPWPYPHFFFITANTHAATWDGQRQKAWAAM